MMENRSGKILSALKLGVFSVIIIVMASPVTWVKSSKHQAIENEE